jgi:hypothetical protein
MPALYSDFAPQAGTGLNVLIQPGSVVNNGTLLAIGKTTTILLGAGTTSYVFLDVQVGAISFNTTGFLSFHMPIAIVTTGASTIASIVDQRPALFCVPGRLQASGGATQVAANVALSAQWGTSPSAAITGTDSRFVVTVTAQATTTANPTVTITFNNIYPAAPVALVSPAGGTGTQTLWTASPTSSTAVLTFNGTPAAGSTYAASVLVIG